jgi:hypothetical protein
MAHWAEVDENGTVLRVTYSDNSELNEGYDWLAENLGGVWLKTSYNTFAGEHLLGGTPFRGNYAGIGFTYDEELDAFIPPKPYPSWELDEATYSWVAPIPMPEDGFDYVWDEELGDWVEV